MGKRDKREEMKKIGLIIFFLGFFRSIVFANVWPIINLGYDSLIQLNGTLGLVFENKATIYGTYGNLGKRIVIGLSRINDDARFTFGTGLGLDKNDKKVYFFEITCGGIIHGEIPILNGLRLSIVFNSDYIVGGIGFALGT
jgi:hypothetical protein